MVSSCHGYTLPGFLSVRIADFGEKSGEIEGDERISLCELLPSDVEPLGEIIP